MMVLLSRTTIRGEKQTVAATESEGELAYELALFAETVLVVLEDFYVVVPESQGAAPDGGKHQELDVDVR